MESATLICKRCKAPLEYKEGSAILTCSHCGYSEKIDESDSVTIARIHAASVRDAELGKKQIEADTAIEEKRLDIEGKSLDLKKTKIIIATALLVCVAALAVFAGYKIRHRNEIKLPLAAADYCQRDYKDTFQLLEDTGLENIKYVVQKNLSKNESELVGVVTQISVDGNTGFRAGTWFPKTSEVKITYRVLDPEKENDIEIPNSSTSYVGRNCVDVRKEFQKAGFSDITLVPKYDLDIFNSSKNGEIQFIEVDGQNTFVKKWVPENTKVRITYYAEEPKFIGKNYQDVKAKLEEMGFTKIDFKQLSDLEAREMKKDGSVESVSIDNSDFSSVTELNLLDTVTVTYHSERITKSTEIKVTIASKKLVGKDYSEVVEDLKNMGFTDVTSNALNDLLNEWFNKAGSVKAISIGDVSSFKEGDIFDKDVKVVVSYHSLKKA